MRFPGKGIQIIPRGAPGSGCERMGAGSARVLSMGEFPMVGDMVELLSPPGAGKIYVIGPEDDLLRWGHTRFDLHHCSRPESIEEKFFFAGPGHLHRLSSQFGQTGCFHGLMAVRLASKTASHIGGDNPDLWRRNSEGFSNVLFDPERPLRRRPDSHLVLLHLGQGRVRLRAGLIN